MKTYENLASFIELNDDVPQSCLNTTFTRDHKRKILIVPYEVLTWKNKHTSLSI
jgi:predicted transcriptional regulator of viral defense system